MLILTLSCRVLTILISVIELCLLVYAVLSWIPPSGRGEGAFRRFFNAVGDAVTAPMRALLSRFEWARSCPIDLSFLLTLILFTIFRSILSAL